MQPGSIVLYTPRPEEPPHVGIVLSEWPDGSVQLHVFHFEAGAHIRAAHPSEVKLVIDAERLAILPDILADWDRKLEQLQTDFELLRNQLGGNQSRMQTQPIMVDASEVDVESTPEAEREEPVEELVEANSRRSRKWPKP